MKRLLAVWIALIILLPASVHAWEPNGDDLDKAVSTGDFGGYVTNITAWLNQKTPAAPGNLSPATMQGMLKDPVFVNTLDQRKFIADCGAEKTGAFAKPDPANRAFLSWLLKNTQAMDLYLEGCGKATGEPCIASLNIWKTILNADPESKEGIYQKLAIATALAHARPATSFGYDELIDPLKRYQYFKAAHKNKELAPGFDHLIVWEYAKVVDYPASDKDLTWAREMLNTWRPDLRKDNRVVKIVSEVWRRTSPIPYTSFPTLMEGGGKCLARARFGGLICTAFGIPAIGIGQPAHAALACKAKDTWTLEYGVGGWEIANWDGGSGLEFLAEAEARSHAVEYSQSEHLKWLAAALTSKDQADAVLGVAKSILPPPSARQSGTVGSYGYLEANSSPAPVEAKAEGKSVPAAASPATLSPAGMPEAPVKVAPGVIHVEAASFTKSFADPMYPGEQEGRVYVYDCFTGGKQVNFARNMKISWIDYKVDVPASGTYAIELRVATPNRDQVLEIGVGPSKLATVKVPNTLGLWGATQAVDLKLDKGVQTLRISAPFQRGIALRWFELKAK